MAKKRKRPLSALLTVLMLFAFIPTVSRADTTEVRIIKQCTAADDLNDPYAMYLFLDSADGTNYFTLSNQSSYPDDYSYYYMVGEPVTIADGIVTSPNLDNCIGGLTDGAVAIGSTTLFYKYSSLFNNDLIIGSSSSFTADVSTGTIQLMGEENGYYISCDSGGCFIMTDNPSPYFTILKVSDDLDDDPDTPITSGGYSASLQSSTGSSVTVSLDQTNPVASLQVVAVGTGEDFTSIAAGKLVLTYPAEILDFSGITVPTGTTAEFKDENGTVTIAFFGSNTSIGSGILYSLTFTAKGSAGGKQGMVTLTEAAFSSSERAKSSDLTAAELTDTSVTVSVVGQAKDVTLCDGITGPETTTIGASYTFTKTEDSAYWDYTGMAVTMGGTALELSELERNDGTYTISAVTGPITVSGVMGKEYSVTYTYVGNLNNSAAAPENEKAFYNTDYSINMPAVPSANIIAVTAITIGGEAKTPVTNESGYYIPGSSVRGNIAVTIEIVQVSASANGSGGTDVSIPTQPTRGEDFTFSVEYEPGFDYSVSVTVDGAEVSPTDHGNGTFTIPGSKVTGVISIELTKTVNTDGVSVYEYLTLNGANMWLVLDAGAAEAGKVRTCNGQTMYRTQAYDNKTVWCVLVLENADSTEEAVLAAAKNQIAIMDGTANPVSYSADINGSKTVDANDAQLVWNMYNAEYSQFDESKSDGLSMSKFLLADYNHDKKVDSTDAVAVVNFILGNTQ